MPPFHLALPVHDLEQARDFYGTLLGCKEGRSAERWIDYDFFGHQLSVHLVDEREDIATNAVDGDAVPARHFGVVLPWSNGKCFTVGLTDFASSPKFVSRVRSVNGTFFVDDLWQCSGSRPSATSTNCSPLKAPRRRELD